MAWYSRFIQPRSKAADAADDRLFMGWSQLATTLDLPSWVRDGFNWSSYSELLMRYVGWVYVCAGRNSESVAAQAVRLYRTGAPSDGIKLTRARKQYLKSRPDVIKYRRDVEDATEITDHSILDILNHPNPDDDPSTFQQTTQLHQELTGNAYWVAMEIADRESPFELRILQPDKMEFVRSGDPAELIGGWKYHNGSAPKMLEPEIVCHFRMANPRHPVYGYGPLQGTLLSVDQDLMMRAAEIATYNNRSVPAMFLSLLSNTAQKELERMRLEWEAIHKGPQNAGKTALMSNVKVERMGLTPAELKLPEQTMWMRDCIAAAFGVPLSMLTFEGANRASAEAGLYQYARWTILPRLIRRDEKLTQWMLPKFGLDPAEYFFCSDDPTPPNYDWLLKTRTLNEIRAADGLDPIEGGDDAPGAGTAFSFGGGTDTPADAREPDQDEGDRELAVRRSRHKSATQAPDESKAHPLETLCRSVLRAQRDEVIANIIAHPMGGKAAGDRWMFDSKEWDRRLAAEALPIESGIFLDAGASAIRQFGLGVGIAFDVTNVQAMNAVKRTVSRFASAFNRTTRSSLADLFQGAIEAGWAPHETITAVQELMGYAEKYRAERVARTEQRRAVSAGHEEAFNQSGVTQKQWDATGDACEYCIAMHGRIVEVGTPFYEVGQTHVGADGGERVIDYLDIDGPPLHPNCRCVLIPVVP